MANVPLPDSFSGLGPHPRTTGGNKTHEYRLNYCFVYIHYNYNPVHPYVLYVYERMCVCTYVRVFDIWY